MSLYMLILCFLCIAVVIYSIIYTYAIAKMEKAIKGKYDPSVQGMPKAHPFLLNPVLIALVISAVITFGMIFYYAFKG